MTTNVPRGANRPFADGKRTRAGQKAVMLPPKTEAQREAHAAEVAAAREELAERSVDRANKVDVVRGSEAYRLADAFVYAAVGFGWTLAGIVSSSAVGRAPRVTAVITRGDERLTCSWVGSEPSGFPLHSNAGRNARLADLSAAVDVVAKRQ